jgi:cytidine deaminase
MASQKNKRELDAATIADLHAQAARVAANAYAPYSHFHVGAALLLDNGEVVTGCNVENASYRLTSCAEQAAVTRAVTQFGPSIRIEAVAVANADSAVACQPCGACRQTLAEFASGDCLIFYPGNGGTPLKCTLADLLPSSFTAASLQ